MSFPIKNGDFPVRYVNVYQRVPHVQTDPYLLRTSSRLHFFKYFLARSHPPKRPGDPAAPLGPLGTPGTPGTTHWFLEGKCWRSSYPLVNVYITNWKITMFNGKTHYKWPFSIVMLNYQRVPRIVELSFPGRIQFDFWWNRCTVSKKNAGHMMADAYKPSSPSRSRVW